MFDWIHVQWQVFWGLGLFIVCIPIIAIINVKWKLVPRKGFLQMTTTLGLRFFIGMLVLIHKHHFFTCHAVLFNLGAFCCIGRRTLCNIDMGINRCQH